MAQQRAVQPLRTSADEPSGARSREVHTVEIGSLAPADSPRLAGEDGEHAARLAETPDELPPILVHRPTMRVIDGMHRLQAARLRGRETIETEFFDGSAEDAFIQAVTVNTRHGLPLTLADRRRPQPGSCDRIRTCPTGPWPATPGSPTRRSA